MNKLLRAFLAAMTIWIGLPSANSQIFCEENNVIVSLQTGYFGSEVSFQFFDDLGNIVFDSPTQLPQLTDNSFYSVAVCLPDGCYGVAMYDSFGDGWNGAELTISYDNTMVALGTLPYGSYGATVFAVNIEDPACTPPPVLGCTDPAALNYNPTANEDDGSCTYPLACDSGLLAQVYVCTFSNGQNVELEITDSEGNSVFSVNGLGDGAIAFFDICLEENECYSVQMSNAAGLNGWNNAYFWINTGGQQLINESLDWDLSEETVTLSVGAGCPLNGCTDPLALNYNPQATDDDGSCEYPQPCEGSSVILQIYTGAWASEMGWYITDEDGQIIAENEGFYQNNWQYTVELCLQDGCYTLYMTDSFGDGWNGGAIIMNTEEGVTTHTIQYGEFGADAFGINAEGCTADIIGGCMDPEALNYNPDATYNDGSCEYAYYGCTDPAASNYNYWANVDDGSCIYPEPCDGVSSQLYVCTFSNGLCVNLQILDSEGNEILSVSDLNSGQIAYYDLCLNPGECYTAIMSSACGFEGWFGGYFWVNAGGVQLINDYLDAGYNTQTVNFSLDNACATSGCTDPEALNYNPYATEDDGSCTYPEPCDFNEVQLTINGGIFPNEISWYILDADSTEVIAQGGNYFGNSFETLCLPDGCYTFYMNDSFGDGWNNGSATLSFNNEIIAVGTLYQGYNGTFAFGINAEGCVEVEPVTGCTDPLAVNYNPEATIDDNSCVYFQDCDSNAVVIIISTQSWGYEISWELVNSLTDEVVGSGSGYGSWSTTTHELCLPDGCYELHMYDSWGDGWNGGYYMVITENAYSEGTLFYGDYTMDLISINGDCAVTGCTDPEALNYNPNAEVEDGSCIYNGGFGGNWDDFVNPELDFDFDYFPNPFFNEIQIVINNLNPVEDLTIDVFDATGRLVLNRAYGAGREYLREELQLNGLEGGMYIVNVRNGEKLQSARLIKE